MDMAETIHPLAFLIKLLGGAAVVLATLIWPTLGVVLVILGLLVAALKLTPSERRYRTPGIRRGQGDFVQRW